jgi:hypothetical protein
MQESKMKLIHPSAIRYAFVGYGQLAGTPEETRGRLYLDVGNDLRPGVIDHHHLAAYAGSTARLVLMQPELVQQAAESAGSTDQPLTMVVHEHPDLDCVVSAYFAGSLLTRGTYPEGAEALAGYVDRVDAGYPGMSLDDPFALYAACLFLAHRLLQRTWTSREEMWGQLMQEALRVVDFVAVKAASEDRSVYEIDAFTCPGLFGPRDREEVRQDIARYRRKLAHPGTCARRLRLRLPSLFGGAAEVATLLVRDVQNADDPERVLFFKDWARTDVEFSFDKNGFAGLCVYHSPAAGGFGRAILSVKPDSGVCLRGLGALLETEESRKRRERDGVDDREIDPATGQKKPARWADSNSDPWYDGRGHNYTIVDSPRSGTVLSADDVEAVFVRYGRRAEADLEPLPLPSPETTAASIAETEEALRHLSYLGDRPPLAARARGSQPPDVFISYPRSKLAWVEERVYGPLQTWRGAARVFFDRNTLNPGGAWLTELARGVESCRVFLPVYCADYFRRPFCQWELQLAVTRDPTGEKRIVIPLLIEPIDPPGFCRLIQAVDGTGGDGWSAMRTVLQEVLPP